MGLLFVLWRTFTFVMVVKITQEFILLVVSSPLAFGNSWKAATPPCSDVTKEIFPCDRNSYCLAWAQRRCMIITGDTFKDCHLKVCILHIYNATNTYSNTLYREPLTSILGVLQSPGGARSLLPSLCAGVLLLWVWRKVSGLLHSCGSLRRGLQRPQCVCKMEDTWFVP